MRVSADVEGQVSRRRNCRDATLRAASTTQQHINTNIKNQVYILFSSLFQFFCLSRAFFPPRYLYLSASISHTPDLLTPFVACRGQSSPSVSISRVLRRATTQSAQAISRVPRVVARFNNCHAGQSRLLTIDESKLAIVIRIQKKRDRREYPTGQLQTQTLFLGATLVCHAAHTLILIQKSSGASPAFGIYPGATQEGTRAYKFKSQTRQRHCSSRCSPATPPLWIPIAQTCSHHACLHLPSCSFPYSRQALMIASSQYFPPHLIA